MSSGGDDALRRACAAGRTPFGACLEAEVRSTDRILVFGDYDADGVVLHREHGDAAPVSCYNFQPVNVNGNVFHNNPPLPSAASLHHPTSALQPAGLTSAQHPASPPIYQQQ